MTELYQLGIHALSGLIAPRKISVLELTDALIARCSALDELTCAFITPMFGTAREMARARDAELANGQLRGPLHGIPIGLKDAIDVAEIQPRRNDQIGGIDHGGGLRHMGGGCGCRFITFSHHDPADEFHHRQIMLVEPRGAHIDDPGLAR